MIYMLLVRGKLQKLCEQPSSPPTPYRIVPPLARLDRGKNAFKDGARQRVEEPCATSQERMFKWLRWLREETKPVASDASHGVAKSSERGEPPCDVDQIEELVGIVGEAPDPPRKSTERAWPSAQWRNRASGGTLPFDPRKSFVLTAHATVTSRALPLTVIFSSERCERESGGVSWRSVSIGV